MIERDIFHGLLCLLNLFNIILMTHTTHKSMEKNLHEFLLKLSRVMKFMLLRQVLYTKFMHLMIYH